MDGIGEAGADFKEMKTVSGDPRNDDEKAVMGRKNMYRKIGWCRFVRLHVADIHKYRGEQLRQSSVGRP